METRVLQSQMRKMKHKDFVLILIIFISLVIIDGAVKYGPFKATILGIEPCKGNISQHEDNAPIIVKLEVYNTTSKVNLLKGNVTINGDVKIKGVRLKNAIWSNNHWKVVRVMNTVACNGVLVPLAAMMVGIKYNRKNCVVYKGFYSFTDMDNDKAQHAWLKNQEYGKHRWTIEAYTNNDTALCLNSISIVTPPD